MELNKKSLINYLYYEEHLKVKEKKKRENIDSSYVSKIIKNDDRYLIEKQNRKSISNKIHIEKTKKSVKKNREKIRFNNNVDDLILKNLHNQDSMELSKSSYLTNENYRKWNYSAYKYNPSKKRYEFREELGRSYDVPKYIKERN